MHQKNTTRDNLSIDEMRDIQNKNFKTVLEHLFSTPFIERKMAAAGFSITDINSIDDIKKLPFSYKHELRGESYLERSPYNVAELEFLFSSSGTTGTPTISFWTKEDTEVLREAGWRAMKRVGVSEADIALILAPFGLPIMSYCMVNQYQASDIGVVPLGMSPPNLIFETINRLPVSLVTTLPVIASRLFEFGSLNDLFANKTNLKAFHFGGDFLSEQRRQRIMQQWGVDCFNFYGLSEMLGPIAGECKEKNGLHVLYDYIYVEVINPNTLEPVNDNEIGVAVYTTLWKKGAPLLRFWSDDFVKISNDKCACGSTSPRLEFLGRVIDSINIKGNLIFSKEIEEEVLRFPVGGEYQLTVNNDNAILMVEALAMDSSCYTLLTDAIAKKIGSKVSLIVEAPGKFDRSIVKPRRIIDNRTS